MTLGTYQIAFPDMEISYPEQQFRADGRLLFGELRSKFLRGMAEVYDRFAEKARQKYNELDPATDRPPLPQLGMVMIGAGIAPQGADQADAALAAAQEQVFEKRAKTPRRVFSPRANVRATKKSPAKRKRK